MPLMAAMAQFLILFGLALLALRLLALAFGRGAVSRSAGFAPVPPRR